MARRRAGVFVSCVGMAVPLNLQDFSPPLIFIGRAITPAILHKTNNSFTMRKFLLLAVAIALHVVMLTSCSTSKSVLSKSYDVQKTFTTQQSFDHVWNNVIDLFAETGITITNMEKASGLITANGIIFNDHYTVENKNDKRYNPNAYFIIPNGKFDSAEITASFNVRVRQNDDNTVSVSINLPNLKGVTHKRDIWTGVTFYKDVDVASTGVFEQMLFDLISK